MVDWEFSLKVEQCILSFSNGKNLSLNRFVSSKPFPELLAVPLHEILDKLPSSRPTVDHVNKIGIQMLQAYVKKNFQAISRFSFLLQN